MIARNRHGEPGVLRLLDRHLAVPIHIDARDVTVFRHGLGFSRTLGQPERLVHLVRVHVVERIGNDISFDSVCVLIV